MDGEEDEGGANSQIFLCYCVFLFFFGSNLQMIDDDSQVHGLSVLYLNKN